MNGIRVRVFVYGKPSAPVFVDFHAVPRVGDEIQANVWGERKGIQVVDRVVWQKSGEAYSAPVVPTLFLLPGPVHGAVQEGVPIAQSDAHA